MADHPEPDLPDLSDPVRVGVVRGRRALLTQHGRNPERIIFFSDAVVAIALTLLVLDIRLGEVADTELGAALLAVAPKVGAFAISFLIVVSAGGTHFRMFRLVRGFDPALIRINLAFLFLVCLMPFTTSVMAEHGDSPWSLIPYGANLGLIFATTRCSGATSGARGCWTTSSTTASTRATPGGCGRWRRCSWCRCRSGSSGRRSSPSCGWSPGAC